ncbi:Organic cation transporter 1 [Armadillidium vulgare]|nr:Organic cation transporter 1 [Armadillidium vulgare]
MSGEKDVANGNAEKNYLLEEASGKDPLKDSEIVTAFDRLLDCVGSDGVFQRRLIWWFMLPFSIAYGMAEVHFIFVLTTPGHVCHVPGREYYQNTTLEQWHNMTIPWEKSSVGELKMSQCKMYASTLNLTNQNYSSQLDYSFETENTTDISNVQYGWDYDKSVWESTAVSHFDLVCDKKQIVTNLLTLRMIGGTIGNFGFAVLSDSNEIEPCLACGMLGNVDHLTIIYIRTNALFCDEKVASISNVIWIMNTLTSIVLTYSKNTITNVNALTSAVSHELYTDEKHYIRIENKMSPTQSSLSN